MGLYYVIIIMMKALGFGVDWCPITYRSMSSASFSIMLNVSVFDNFLSPFTRLVLLWKVD